MSEQALQALQATSGVFTNGTDVADDQPQPWLIDAADLLAEPDPGPTPWLIHNLIVDQAFIACVGKWKTTKSYGILDLCISIATGQPAFGHLPIPNPGPVVFINEESGRAALWRRLDALTRGRAVDPEQLRTRLYVAANQRVRLDDAYWQQELVDIGQAIRPRLYVFDPFARMKSPSRDENAQTDMAPIIDYARHLRTETMSAVALVHHTGHSGEHMRGSSDLESAWETRLAWKREGQSPVIAIESEHREAEAISAIKYRVNWDPETRTMRFDHQAEELDERVHAYMRDHPEATANDVAAGVEGNRQKILQAVRDYQSQSGSEPWNHPGTTPPEASFQVVPHHPPFRGGGNHLEKPGSGIPEPPHQQHLPKTTENPQPEPTELDF